MTSACDSVREALVELAGGQAARLDGIAAHLDGCPDCRARLERWKGHAQALRQGERLTAPALLDEVLAASLTGAGRGVRAAAALGGIEPVTAPAELEGRVVAAFFAGHRQDRAVEQVKSLPNVDAPRGLQRRVEEIAPGELALVVAEVPSPLTVARTRSASRRTLSAIVLAAAAAALLWLSPIWPRGAATRDVAEPPQKLALSFEVVRSEDGVLDGDDLARSMASAVMGGYLEAHQ